MRERQYKHSVNCNDVQGYVVIVIVLYCIALYCNSEVSGVMQKMAMFFTNGQ